MDHTDACLEPSYANFTAGYPLSAASLGLACLSRVNAVRYRLAHATKLLPPTDVHNACQVFISGYVVCLQRNHLDALFGNAPAQIVTLLQRALRDSELAHVERWHLTRRGVGAGASGRKVRTRGLNESQRFTGMLLLQYTSIACSTALCGGCSKHLQGLHKIFYQ